MNELNQPEQMVEANDNRSFHIGSGHGWILSREADLVPYFQQLNVSHSSSHPRQIHPPRQDLLSGHPNLQEQRSSFSSDKGEVFLVTRHLSSAKHPSSPTKMTDYRRDCIDVRSVTKDFKPKIKNRVWSRGTMQNESSARLSRIPHDFNTSTENPKASRNTVTPPLFAHVQRIPQDSSIFGKQAEFEALSLDPGCPWTDTVDSFL